MNQKTPEFLYYQQYNVMSNAAVPARHHKIPYLELPVCDYFVIFLPRFVMYFIPSYPNI